MARGSFPGLLLVAVTAIAAAGATQYLWRQQAAPAPLAMPEQVPPAPEMEVPDAAEPAMLPPDMALTGVVLNSDESKSTAWIEHGGRPAQSYRLGERVNNDYELLAIRPSHVLLEKTGQTYQLELGRAPTGAAQDQHLSPRERRTQAALADPAERRARLESRREAMRQQRGARLRGGSEGRFGGGFRPMRKAEDTQSREHMLESARQQPVLESDPAAEPPVVDEASIPDEPASDLPEEAQEPEPVEDDASP